MKQRGIVLTHGAGGNARAPLLIKVASYFEEMGWAAVRYDLPFRQKRPHGGPWPGGAADDRAGLRAAAAELRAKIDGPVWLGGHSYGGRQASMLLAEEPEAADGLVLLSYPLHPPKKLEQLRTAHFRALRTRALFIHGTRDEFGTLDEMREALKLIPAETRLQVVEGAGHDLKKGAFGLECLHDFCH